ncbi:MAG TPA: PAS domain S-box protein [Bryobacteraceae bacterium]
MSPAEGSRRLRSKLRIAASTQDAVLRALEDASGTGISVAGPDGRLEYVNATFCDLVGMSEEELLGAAPPFAFWPPEERGRIEAALRSASLGRTPTERLELSLQKRGGERFDARVAISPVRDETGLAAGWLASISDITERKRYERRRAAEYEIARIVGRTSGLAEAAPLVIRAMCEHLGWDMGALWRVQHGGSVLEPVAEAWVAPRAAGGKMTSRFQTPSGTGLPGRVCASGQPAWIAGLSSFEGLLRGETDGAAGPCSAFAFPICTGAGVAGVMEFFSRQTCPADRELIELAETLGRQIGQCVEREEAQVALRRSEERYRTIVETANEGVWLIDTQARTVYANRQLSEMLGVSPQELPGRGVAEFCYPEDLPAVLERIRANFEGHFEQFDFRLRRADGSERLTLACTSPMKDEQGSIVGALGLLSDVTDRKKADEAVHRLAAIVESSDDAIIGKTLEGIIQSWNSAAERIYGYTAEEAVGRSMTMLLPPDRPDEESAVLERLHKGRRVEHFETVRLRKDGHPIEVSMTISPIRDKEGRVIGASNITRDITERRRFEEHLRETQKLESLGVLAGGVAHDFNNLLVGIMGNASLALDSIAEEDPVRSMIESLLQASERAANLTRQLLAYSGRGQFVVQSTDVSRLIREIVALIQTSIPKSVRLSFALENTLPAIEADVAQIQQLVMNLVINAAEAIGEVPGTVTVRTYQEFREAADAGERGTYVALEVEDTGCGMDQATRERIFDPFFTTKFTGRGLGLAAVLGIVRGHRGRIQVDTAPGEGTRFRVSFPAATAPAPHQRPRVAGDFRGKGTVLVVDDEEIVRTTARITLERYGYEVLVAADGAEALDCLRKAPQVTVVLLDLTMPIMSGEEALHEIRRIRPQLRVILSSGYNEIEATRRFRGQGLSGFLQKPYSADALGEKVKAAVAA